MLFFIKLNRIQFFDLELFLALLKFLIGRRETMENFSTCNSSNNKRTIIDILNCIQLVLNFINKVVDLKENKRELFRMFRFIFKFYYSKFVFKLFIFLFKTKDSIDKQVSI